MKTTWTSRGADGIARIAVEAIKAERDISPRPATSRDGISKEALHTQAEGLLVYFTDCARLGEQTDDLRLLFDLIREKGVAVERQSAGRPLKGAMFALGILCAAAGHNQAHDGVPDARQICGLAMSMTRMALYNEMSGEPLHGARQEATDGFASAQRAARPKYNEYIKCGLDRNAALARAYLPLMANAEDTAAIRSAGADNWKSAAQEAALMMDANPTDEALKGFYSGLSARGFVFDGCAALMACLIFLCEYPAR